MKREYSEKTRMKMSEAKKGNKNPRWNEGASEYPEHSFLKKQRLEVLKKAKGKCEVCGKSATVIHHIDGSKDNHDLSNLVALCNRCHCALHNHDLGIHAKRTSKFIRIYGMTLKEMAVKLNTSGSTVLSWLKNPEKKKWLEKQIFDEDEAREGL